MRRWYSDRGAKRGLLAITVFGILWGCWAIIYTKELANIPGLTVHRLELQQMDTQQSTCECTTKT